MKHFTMRVFTACLLLMASLGARSEIIKATIDGLNYSLDTEKSEATVAEGDYKGDIIIPDEVEYEGRLFSVISIGDEAFYECTSLTSVVIGDAVKTIGAFTFYGCTSLVNLIIGKSVEYLDWCIFARCSALTSVSIPKSVMYIDFSAFQGCSSINSILVEKGNEYYDSRDNCNAIISKEDNCLIRGCNTTIIPKSVKSIGSSAFSGCSSLTSVTIPESVESIGLWAFSGCSSLTSITIPKSVENIENLAFRGCTSLTSISVENGNKCYDSRNNCNAIIRTKDNTLTHGCNTTVIPESVKTIGANAFTGLSFTSISIPNSVTNIGYAAFGSNTSLTSIVIPNSVTNVDGAAFISCTSLKSVTISNSLTSISDDTFRSCRSLTSVTIPNSVTNIGYCAFWDCTSLKSIVISENVTSIGDLAFLGSNNPYVYCLSSEMDNYGHNIFSEFGDRETLYVPTHSIEKYSVWSEYFSEILPGDPEQANAVANKGSNTHYSSFSNPYSDTELTVETGKTLTLYNVKVVDGEMVLTERADNKVAKGEGVLVCTDAADIVVNPLATTDLVPAEDNDLVATSVLPNDTVYAEDGHVLYRLTYKNASSESGLGFYLGVLKDKEGNVVSADGSALPTTPFKAYLSVPAEAASGLDKAPAYGFELGEGDATGLDGLPTDGLEDTDLPMYDLSGRRTNKTGKGILIRGEKKYLVK